MANTILKGHTYAVRKYTFCDINVHYLPGRETGSTHEVTTGFDLHVFVILGADLAELEGGAHLTVELILLLVTQTTVLSVPAYLIHHQGTLKLMFSRTVYKIIWKIPHLGKQFLKYHISEIHSHTIAPCELLTCYCT